MQTISSTPILDYYNTQCDKGIIFQDICQLNAIHHLQVIYNHLIQEQPRRSNIFSLLRKPKLVPGLYLWGGVGIGKSFLMDCFYQRLPFLNKIRMHFHQFMQMIHDELKIYQGNKNPLNLIARKLAKKYLLVCLDEFFVSDIADAMLLSQFFHALFLHGVCLVTTSNIMPDDLYKNGLQRKSFLPTISLLKQHTTVLHLPSIVDYRLHNKKEAGIYFSPNNDITHKKMEFNFTTLSNNAPITANPIQIGNRYIEVIKKTDNLIWFDFKIICAIPRCQQDYLEIVKTYHTIFISNIPILSPDEKNQISLFIRLIDILYDNRIRLVISSEVPVDKIYHQGQFYFDFLRTRSRLLEMQSEEYILNITK